MILNDKNIRHRKRWRLQIITCICGVCVLLVIVHLITIQNRPHVDDDEAKKEHDLMEISNDWKKRISFGGKNVLVDQSSQSLFNPRNIEDLKPLKQFKTHTTVNQLKKMEEAKEYSEEERYFHSEIITEEQPIMEKKITIDQDETIDQNPWREEFQDERNSKVRRLTCDVQHPKSNVVYLHINRAASSTLSNIFYRYGELNQLKFVLPKQPTFQHHWPFRFHHSYTDHQLLNSKCNMLINVPRFRMSSIKPLIQSDSVIITMLRNPIEHFASIFEYIDATALFRIDGNNTMETFLRSPGEYIIQHIQSTQRLEPEINLLKNGMLFDLGLDESDMQNEATLISSILKIEEEIDLVLIMDYFDESLVLMKRKLCWTLDDILYIQLKERRDEYRLEITSKSKDLLNEWNDGDVLLFDHFNKTFWSNIEKEGAAFWNDLLEFRAKLKIAHSSCFEERRGVQKANKFHKPQLKVKNNLSRDINYGCKLLIQNETSYVERLKFLQRLRMENEMLVLKNKENEEGTNDMDAKDELMQDVKDERALFE